QIKDTKINRLVHDYELFTMLENENISSMARFNDIINALKCLGKVTNHGLVSKILRCLLKSWEPKVTVIEEAKDLSTLPLEDLLGSLMTHELRMSDQERNDPKKKTIALKASKEEESDEEMALLTKRIRKILMDKKNFSKKQLKKPECPKLKKKKDNFKKKAMITTWSDSDDSSSDDEENEEVVNIAFMSIEDENDVTHSSLSFNEL
ncbi:LOW QUALITY PROTEIN: UBN2 domain-containing protein, partial [Cephalotus follicularis]